MAQAGVVEPYPTLTISFLRGDTGDPACTELADRLFDKFTAPHPKHPEYGAYQNGCSILVLPQAFDDYWMGPAGYYTRRRVRKAQKLGYTFEIIDRDQWIDDIFAINTSMAERQGREMTESYRSRPDPYGEPPPYPCPRHQVRTYGVIKDGHLYAYSWVFQVGEMCLFSTILGHGDHLADGVMFLLISEILRDLLDVAGTRYAMYNMHISGTEGLRFFKEQMGFRGYWVDWQRNDEPPLPARRPAAVRRSPAQFRRFTPRRIVRGIRRRLKVGASPPG
jgi:hypothetical protein